MSLPISPFLPMISPTALLFVRLPGLSRMHKSFKRGARNERNLVRLAQKSQEINWKSTEIKWKSAEISWKSAEINLRNHLKSLAHVNLPPTPPILLVT